MGTGELRDCSEPQFDPAMPHRLGVVIAMPFASCDFCHEFSGSTENAFDRIYSGSPESRILFRSNQFAVIPSVGQLVEGYLLVLPINHFKALGDMPGPLLQEFAAICETVGNILKDQYGPYVLFEHGTRSEGAGGCGIYHAHLHAVSLAEVPDPVNTLKSRFAYVELSRLDEISKRSTGLSSYLFYQDSHARAYLFDTGPLPSQYMRKLLADAQGNRDWDWRIAGREERLLSTIRRLSGQFGSPQDLFDAPTQL
jgi:diadenosine tetraphosphate (Ap4A) HIT family hydrolase